MNNITQDQIIAELHKTYNRRRSTNMFLPEKLEDLIDGNLFDIAVDTYANLGGTFTNADSWDWGFEDYELKCKVFETLASINKHFTDGLGDAWWLE